MASTAALANSGAPDSYHITVPDWIEKNNQIFGACPPGVVRSNTRGLPAPVMKSEEDQTDDDDWKKHAAAACMAAMLINTKPGVGWIDAPHGLQPASYFREVKNHPNILATIAYTTRQKAGFVPGVMGQHLSLGQWKDYIDKFNAWLRNLDRYWFYVNFVDHTVCPIESPSTSDVIVDTLSKHVLKTFDEANDKKVMERIMTTFERAVKYMVEKNINENTTTLVKACFQHEAFGAPGPSNPTLPISLTITTLNEIENQSNSSSTIQYNATTMNLFTLQLNSTNIIASAETLAQGTRLLSTKAYCDFINEWDEGGAIPPLQY